MKHVLQKSFREICEQTTEVSVLRDWLLSGQIAIIKDFLEPDISEKYVLALIQYGLTEPANNPLDGLPDLYKRNFHRRDINPPKAKSKRIFHEFNLNDFSNLPSELKHLSEHIFGRMLSFQNVLASTNAELPLHGTKEFDGNSLMSHPQVIHYPRGGGWFEKHIHPFLPQKFGLILNLTGQKDFSRGGTVFECGSDLVEVEQQQDVGDLTIFRYDIPHWVSPVDPEVKPISWDSPDGRWVCILPYYSQTQLASQ